jgi:hypothetical protein
MLPGFILTPMAKAADKALARTLSGIGWAWEITVAVIRGGKH